MKFTSLILILMLFSAFLYGQPNSPATNPDPHRFDNEINNFVQWDKKNSFPEDAILFVGSSSIRLWNTQESFPELTIINRGFGGAHISDVNFFIEQTTLKYSASIILFYCGDNDIAGEKAPEQVLSDYKLFVKKVHENRTDTKILFLPIKPSILRWSFWPEMEAANKLIADYSDTNELLYYIDLASPMLAESSPPPADLFIEDGLHLSKQGYDMWVNILDPILNNLLIGPPKSPSIIK